MAIDCGKDTNYAMVNGDTLEFFFEVYKQVGTAPPVPFSLTGSTIWMTAKRDRNDPDPGVFQITSPANISIRPAPDDHIADVRVPPAATQALTQDEILYYDIQVKWSPVLVKTVHSGTLTITRGVTQAT